VLQPRKVEKGISITPYSTVSFASCLAAGPQSDQADAAARSTREWRVLAGAGAAALQRPTEI
jgi:hypothetical protein